MNIAFYAPLKPPGHPTPSGDRYLARAFMQALSAGGHHVELASTFRSREGRGCAKAQARIDRVGRHLAQQLVRRWRRRPPTQRPEAWFTYHLYHKAPDLLGPAVSRALDIPYLVAEASHAPKQRAGPWSVWHRICETAIGDADLILCLNRDDLPCLRKVQPDPSRVRCLLPFFVGDTRVRHETRDARAAAHGVDPKVPWLLAVGMMRPGRKTQSYEVLAAALEQLTDREWVLWCAGDGETRHHVERAFASVARRVRWTGRLSAPALSELYADCDVFTWPAVGEPLGMVFLEAQAAGLPVVAGSGRGVPDLVADGRTGFLVAEDAPHPFAAALARLLDAPSVRQAMGERARRYVAEHHSLVAATAALDRALDDAKRGRIQRHEREFGGGGQRA